LQIVGEFPWSDVPGYIIAQILGAFTGATIVWIFYKAHWKKTTDAGAKKAVFCTAPAERSLPNNLVSEVIGTFFLMLGLSYIGVFSFADGLNPIVVGTLITAHWIFIWRHYRICHQSCPGFGTKNSSCTVAD
jgi:glycerol uptake facilitator protein